MKFNDFTFKKSWLTTEAFWLFNDLSVTHNEKFIIMSLHIFKNLMLACARIEHDLVTLLFDFIIFVIIHRSAPYMMPATIHWIEQWWIL